MNIHTHTQIHAPVNTNICRPTSTQAKTGTKIHTDTNTQRQDTDPQHISYLMSYHAVMENQGGLGSIGPISISEGI